MVISEGKWVPKNVLPYKALDPWDPLPWNKGNVFTIKPWYSVLQYQSRDNWMNLGCCAEPKARLWSLSCSLKRRKNPWSPASGSLYMLFPIPGINSSLTQKISSGLWFCLLQKLSLTLSHLQLTPPACSCNLPHLLSCGDSPVHCGQILK